MGVDPVDRLDIKLDKFKTQIALSAQPEVAAHLKSLAGRWANGCVDEGLVFEHFKRMAAPVLPKDAARLQRGLVVPCRGLARNLVGCWGLGGHRSEALVAHSSQLGGSC